ncbi:MAG: hypothetical protein QM726_24910 [Chitinophagaceae bacterium]
MNEQNNFKNPPMKPAVFKILAFSFILITSFSCKKSDTDTPVAPKSKTTLLTQSTWKVQTVGVDANKDGVAESDVTSLVPACKLDNVYTFKSDGTGSMDEGAAKCNSADAQTQSFTWTFKTNETILSGTFSFTSSDATIVSMTETTMIVGYDDASTSSHLIATLKH